MFLILSAATLAQKSSLYIPRNIIKAYEKGTRSYDGKPGANYWVNRTDYKIQAEVFPKEHTVKGFAQIKFYNQSPDTLKRLVFRLYQVPIDLNVTYTDSTTENIHKSTALWKTGNKETKIDLKTKKEIQKVELNTKLVPDADSKNNVFELKKK